MDLNETSGESISEFICRKLVGLVLEMSWEQVRKEARYPANEFIELEEDEEGDEIGFVVESEACQDLMVVDREGEQHEHDPKGRKVH